MLNTLRSFLVNLDLIQNSQFTAKGLMLLARVLQVLFVLYGVLLATSMYLDQSSDLIWWIAYTPYLLIASELIKVDLVKYFIKSGMISAFTFSFKGIIKYIASNLFVLLVYSVFSIITFTSLYLKQAQITNSAITLDFGPEGVIKLAQFSIISIYLIFIILSILGILLVHISLAKAKKQPTN
jgi:hypothetical protein